MGNGTDEWARRRLWKYLVKVPGEPVTTDDWNWLVAEGYVSDVLDVFADGQDEAWLEEQAGDLAKRLERRRQSLGSDRLIETLIRTNLPPTILAERDLAAAIAQSYALADWAQTLDAVDRFRHNELGGSLLDEAGATEYLAKLLPVSDWYGDVDVPEHDRFDEDTWSWVSIDETAPLARSAESLFVQLPWIEVSGPGTLVERHRRWQTSPLHVAAKATAEQLPWTEGQAAWALLTNQVPWVSPLRASVEIVRLDAPSQRRRHEQSRVRLEYDGLLSPESVRRLQVHIHRDVLKIPNKRTSIQAYAIYVLMADLRRRLGQHVSPSMVQKTWQRYAVSGPETAVPSTSVIGRAYRRVERALWQPFGIE